MRLAMRPTHLLVYLERCLLVQTAELYSPGKYVNWNLSFFNGKPMLAM